jgi:hypothetical protein
MINLELKALTKDEVESLEIIETRGRFNCNTPNDVRSELIQLVKKGA